MVTVIIDTDGNVLRISLTDMDTKGTLRVALYRGGTGRLLGLYYIEPEALRHTAADIIEAIDRVTQ